MIVIPTRGRLESLKRTIASIPTASGIPIVVVCDGDPKTHEAMLKLEKEDRRIVPVLLPEQMGAVYARNRALNTYAQLGHWVVCATDDVEFRPRSIELARAALFDHWADGDGVVGFVQEPNAFHPTGVVCVGLEWLDRYPGRWMYNPAYFHFACQEIHWYATRLDRFFQCPGAIVKHDTTHRDATYIEARYHMKIDKAVRNRRHDAGLVWGIWA